MRIGLLIIALISAGCATFAPLPPSTAPETVTRIQGLRLVRQLATADEAAGYLLQTISGTAAALGVAGTLTVDEERAVQRGVETVAVTLRRRLRDIREQIADTTRPAPTRAQIIRDFLEDIGTLTRAIGLVRDASARAELRGIGLAVSMLFTSLDLALDVPEDAHAADAR